MAYYSLRLGKVESENPTPVAPAKSGHFGGLAVLEELEIARDAYLAMKQVHVHVLISKYSLRWDSVSIIKQICGFGRLFLPARKEQKYLRQDHPSEDLSRPH